MKFIMPKINRNISGAPKSKNRQPHNRRLETTGFYSLAPWRKFRAKYFKDSLEEDQDAACKMFENTNGPTHIEFINYLESEKPLCVHCFELGRLTAANVLDHIKPINRKDPFDTKDGVYGEPLSVDNVQPLCDRCHNKKSGREAH